MLQGKKKGIQHRFKNSTKGVIITFLLLTHHFLQGAIDGNGRRDSDRQPN